MTPSLNWKELALLIPTYRKAIEGLFVDRVLIAERPRYPGGYIKGEWVLRLTGRGQECSLIFSIRARSPYLALSTGRGARAAPSGTHNVFDLSLGKFLRGSRVLGIEVVARERTVLVWFSGEGGGPRLALVLKLIPAAPEALVVTESPDGPRILARSRGTESGIYVLPDGMRAPDDLPVRAELVGGAGAFLAAVEKGLEDEAFTLRLATASRALKEIRDVALHRIRADETAQREAEREPDWKVFGDLLKSSLSAAPEVVRERDAKGTERFYREVHDYSADALVRVPCDPKLSPRDQVEKFYSLNRRKLRRLSEAEGRLEFSRSTVARMDALISAPPSLGDWAALSQFEASAGLGAKKDAAPDTSRKARGKAWQGRTFTSRDGSVIWVGKSKDENLDLTFKHAHGNDLWMHIRGKPGAHVVIPLQSGKSAPLETLLDAAHLAVFYSGGEKWGKTEVDYTFKKYVKRIKDSTEASYTNNKTLLVEPDPNRLKRLLGPAPGSGPGPENDEKKLKGEKKSGNKPQ